MRIFVEILLFLLNKEITAWMMNRIRIANKIVLNMNPPKTLRYRVAKKRTDATIEKAIIERDIFTKSLMVPPAIVFT